MPDLVTNAYYLLGKDWQETKQRWEEAGHKVPPVIITVANRVETSARIKYSFDHNQILIQELCNASKTLQIDSKVLEKAESQEESQLESILEEDEDLSAEDLTKKEQAELLRLMVDTVGQIGEPGEQIQNVISVGMLSEGWDAKTVTHIMGLRAFSSQLLCEQVVGRGLRRTSYEIGKDGLFEPEYVNIFGVPFTFLPHEETTGTPPSPPDPKTQIEPDSDKKQYEIKWPNIIRIEHIYKPILELDLDKVEKIELDPYDSITSAELATIIVGKPNLTALSEIDLMEIAEKYRIQTIIFETVKRIYNYENPNWKGRKEFLLAQLIKIVEKFIKSDKIVVNHNLFSQNRIKRRVLILLNMDKVVQHIWQAIRVENTKSLEPVFDSDYPKVVHGMHIAILKEEKANSLLYNIQEIARKSLTKVFKDKELTQIFSEKEQREEYLESLIN